MTTVFQRVLNDIDRQRVHLGPTGLSTSDLVFFLRQCTLDDLGRLIAPHLARPVRPLFLLTDLITDQAEYELLQRKRHVAEWCELPEAQDSPLSPPQRAAEFPELGRLVTQLQSETRPTVPLTEVVPWGSFEESAYRLSMLSLLGDSEAAESGGLVARLASLPYTLDIEAEEAVVDRAGVARMNVGHLHQLPKAVTWATPLVHMPSSSVPSPSTGEGQGGGESSPASGEDGRLVSTPVDEGASGSTPNAIGQEPQHVP
jgi:hypothetical protein